MKDALVIFLHGVGSRGADLAPLAELWAQALPHVAFEAPDAPMPFDGGGHGHQWFSVSGVTEANRPARVATARPAFDALIRGLMVKHGLDARPDRLAFVGFSQGAIMALDAVADGRWPVAGIVAFSGRLATDMTTPPEPGSPVRDTNVLLIHGSADPVIAASESIRAEALLTGAGIPAASRIIPGLGHTISQEGAAWGAEFLAAVLA